jgi:hypothetical protein
MGLQRKKVTVRTKKGKVYQRTVMVRADQPKRREVARSALHAFGHGLVSGTVGGAVHQGMHSAAGGWFGGTPSAAARMRAAAFGAMSSMIVGKALYDRTRSGKSIQRTIDRGSRWQRAAIAASSTLGSAVGVALGSHAARKIGDRIMRPYINNISEAAIRAVREINKNRHG